MEVVGYFSLVKVFLVALSLGALLFTLGAARMELGDENRRKRIDVLIVANAILVSALLLATAMTFVEFRPRNAADVVWEAWPLLVSLAMLASQLVVRTESRRN
ncbi:MAG: hypothetical protein ACREBN_08805 [Burkholderiaceae bacterium]